ncbi:hypothetical protein [Streptomyces shenzhenensis]|uniref:hypothetical protein n=1 Tax=Streptomyces shenzhenensis TaxID=943815 RepID=UPI001F269D39|nr:hypothetical protein [Streptomyces shenzhenensis]
MGPGAGSSRGPPRSGRCRHLVEDGEYRVRLPREERQEVVASLRDSGLSTRAIASATGIAQDTVRRDLAAGERFRSPDSAQITGTDGKTYTVTREPEVIDAELVDEPSRPEPPKTKRRPLPEAFTDAGRDLTRAAERLARLTEDDRFGVPPGGRERGAQARSGMGWPRPDVLGRGQEPAHSVVAWGA